MFARYKKALLACGANDNLANHTANDTQLENLIGYTDQELKELAMSVLKLAYQDWLERDTECYEHSWQDAAWAHYEAVTRH